MSVAPKKPNGARVRSYGPVLNPEEYVQPDWWNKIFNSLYIKTDADVVEDRRLTVSEVDLFGQILGLKKDERILDLSCGQGRHSLELARRGFTTVEGLDRSRYLLQRARSQALKEGLPVKFREGDARSLSYPADTFDVVLILGNSFGYYESVQDDLRVLRQIHRILKPWGRMLIDVTDGDHVRSRFQPRSWEWIDKNMFVCRERSLSADRQCLISREVVTHVEKGVVADQFYSERLYSQESMTDLLKQAGFQDILNHGEINTESTRNQDLGMMEKRIIVSGTVKKEWSPVRKKRPAVKSITVIMGDPSKSDPLKPSSVFDDDDFYTIDQLKSALREIGDYDFRYFDNHDTLYTELPRIRANSELVFNLCDEGYNNDPRKELHVPSLLEVNNIDYTGSGPQCLAFCYDKSLVRGLSREMEIPVPEAILIKPQDAVYELPFGFPVLVKPNFGDSSFGITQASYAESVEDLVKAVTLIRDKLGYEKPILVEEFLPGKDLSVGIIGNPPDNYTVLPVIEEDYSQLPSELPQICGYEAKWDPDSPYWKIRSQPANLSRETEKLIVDCCLKLIERLDCRDYTRFDWRLDAQGNPRLLEVNPNPGWCWDGHLAKMAALADISYSEMLHKIVLAAEERVRLKNGI